MRKEKDSKEFFSAVNKISKYLLDIFLALINGCILNGSSCNVVTSWGLRVSEK